MRVVSLKYNYGYLVVPYPLFVFSLYCCKYTGSFINILNEQLLLLGWA